ncbi:MAG: HPr-rel-A system PqqD family peptide chaperone [Gallionella sp.]|nr:MAG: HPr-rel-A system PqqD family peptide chaperone [Gallionella sp.]
MMWRLISDHAFCFRSWNDEFVVYNSLSGDTHLLGLAAAQILLELQQAPSDAITLATSLAPLLQAEIGEEFSLQIEHLLADLDKLALIEHS